MLVRSVIIFCFLLLLFTDLFFEVKVSISDIRITYNFSAERLRLSVKYLFLGFPYDLESLDSLRDKGYVSRLMYKAIKKRSGF